MVDRLKEYLPSYIKSCMGSLGRQATAHGGLRGYRLFTLAPNVDRATVLMVLFNFFDGGKGVVEAADVYAFARSLNISWPVGVPNSGPMGIAEFVRVFRDLWVTSVASDEVQQGLQILWKWADMDKSGKLDATERVRFMTRLGLKPITWVDADRD